MDFEDEQTLAYCPPEETLVPIATHVSDLGHLESETERNFYKLWESELNLKCQAYNKAIADLSHDLNQLAQTKKSDRENFTLLFDQLKLKERP